ncbi:hypothetical protein HZH66_014414 [Vespula vulgaris]|uniref:Uncharacterized protein n=1 Tax=Vespula vulgaris TaxID=7454 RepID=A0A834MQN2_VESVU|nr:hypothetical protein HZH66_014414 [Vespula vulgaris]
MYTSLESTVIASESLYFWAMTTVTEAKAAVVKAAITAIAEAAIATVTDLLLFWLAKRQARRSSRRSTISPTTRTDIVLTHLSVQVYQHIMKNFTFIITTSSVVRRVRQQQQKQQQQQQQQG